MQVPTEFCQAIERLYLEAESLLALKEQVGYDDPALIEESINML